MAYHEFEKLTLTLNLPGSNVLGLKHGIIFVFPCTKKKDFRSDNYKFTCHILISSAHFILQVLEDICNGLQSKMFLSNLHRLHHIYSVR